MEIEGRLPDIHTTELPNIALIEDGTYSGYRQGSLIVIIIKRMRAVPANDPRVHSYGTVEARYRCRTGIRGTSKIRAIVDGDTIKIKG